MEEALLGGLASARMIGTIDWTLEEEHTAHDEECSSLFGHPIAIGAWSWALLAKEGANKCMDVDRL